MLGACRLARGATGPCAWFVVFAALLMASAAAAATPSLMNYQGYLSDASNVPLNGAYPMQFRLYADSTTGAPLWSESYASVTVSAGVFNVVLGAGTPLPAAVFSGTKLWLLTTVDGVDVVPRRPIVSVAYAFRSQIADSAASLPVTTGAIVGQVQGCSAPLAAALVYIPGRSFIAYTSSLGTFDLGSVPPGTYAVHVEAGSASMDISNVVVTAGGVANVGVVTLGQNLASDPNNCGACGVVCTTTNGTPACVGGVCAIGSCNSGFGNCDGNVANGCETNTANNVTNCGSCGIVCSAPNGTPGCSAGACTIVACNAGFSNCDGISANGCEVNTTNNVNNCGACGLVCNLPNANEACTSGICTIASCSPGFGNCDGLSANGCETNLSNNNSHCGVCGNICPGGTSCVAGVCQ